MKVQDISRAQASARTKVVDELGLLARKLKAVKADMARFEAIKKIIRGWAEDDNIHAAEAQEYEGRKYIATASAQAFERAITGMEAVYEVLGRTDFLKHCGFTLGKLDVLVPDAAERGILNKTQTGSRTITVEPKQPKLAAAA